jgi:hypothetical protein
MNIKGNISIMVNREYTSIEIRDSNANVQFLKIALSPYQLSAALSRQAEIECELQLKGLDRVGKKMENKKFEFQLPEDLTGWNADKDKIARYAQTLLSDGWIADGYFNSKDSFFKWGDTEYARCTVRRWV